jgi:hypothetical protein
MVAWQERGVTAALRQQLVPLLQKAEEAAQSPQSFDSAAAALLGFVSQMGFKGAPHSRQNIRPQPPEVFDGFRGENDSEAHSGQIVARTACTSTVSRLTCFAAHTLKRAKGTSLPVRRTYRECL